jgi:hypothetical protein
VQLLIGQIDRAELLDERVTRETLRRWLELLDGVQRIADGIIEGLDYERKEAEEVE